MASRWKIEICGLDGEFPSNKGYGEVFNCASKQFTYNINSGRTMQFVIDIENPRANALLNDDILMKVYRQNRLGQWVTLMIGDVISVEETGQGDIGLLTVVGVDPFYRLQHQYVGIGIDNRGRGIGWSDGTIAADNVTVLKQVDLGQMMLDLVKTANGTWNTGVNPGSLETTSANVIGPLYAVTVGDTIQQICNTLGAPDFEIVPVEPVFFSWPSTIIGQFNVHRHLGATYNPNGPVIFEYGTGKRNVMSYDRLRSKDGMATWVGSLPQGFPTVVARGDQLVFAQDTNAIVTRGYYQYIVQAENLTSVPLRQELVNESLSVMSNARQQITFVPTVDCELDFTADYNVGDEVTARAFASGAYRYNGAARIYGVTLQTDDNDSETAALTLIPSAQGSVGTVGGAGAGA